MKLSIVAGATSQSINVFIQDSSSTTGAGLTGLLYNTSSLTAYYSFTGTNATSTAITLATLAAVNSAYSSGGFKEIDSTNMPGWYRLDLPNAALATSKGRVVSLHLRGAANMAPCPVEIELTGWDNQDTVRGGMTAMPNAAAGTNGGLPLSVDASGRVDVLKINGTSQTARDIGASVLLSNGTGTGQVSLTTGTVTVGTNNDKTGYALTAAYDLAKTAAQVGDIMKVSSGVGANQISLSSGLVTVGTNNDKTGYTASTVSDKTGYALTSGEKTTIAGNVWDVTLSGHLTSGTTGNALNAAGSAGDPWSTAIPGAYGAGSAGNIVGNNLNATVSSRLPTSSITLSGGSVTVGTNSDKTGYALTAAYDLAKTASQAGDAMTLTSGERTATADAFLNRDMSVGTDSGSPTVRTVRQALRFLRNKFALSGTTLTVYKEDDTTSSWTSTVTTDAAANPVTASDPA